MKYQSNCQWPDGTVSNADGDGVSTGEHDSYEQAYWVCRALASEGLGGERLVFPTSVWITEVSEYAD